MLIYIVVLEEQSSMQIMRSSVLKLASISKNWAGLRLILTAIKIQQRSRRSKIWLVRGYMFGHNDSGFNTTIEGPVHYAWCGSGRKGGGERGKLEIDSAGKVR